MSGFRVGDTVRISNTATTEPDHHCGDIGKIVQDDNTGHYPYRVLINGKYGWYGANELTFVPPSDTDTRLDRIEKKLDEILGLMRGPWKIKPGK